MPHLSQITNDCEQAMSIKYNTIVYDLQREGKKVIIMSLGEAFFDIPLFDMNALPFPDIYHYTDSKGIYELREKLAEYFLKQYDFPFNPKDEIIVTPGSKPAIQMAFMSILNPGDEVLFPEPAWVSYPEQVKLCYGVPVQVPYQKSVYEFESYITSKTKAIIINTPHNPTGKVYTKEELEYLLSLARKYNIWLLSDEAYSDFVLDEKFISLGSIDKEKTHSMIFNSISKNYGISGWRLGYVIANPKVIFNILKVTQHLITCPPSILQFYVAKHFYDILEITLPQIQALVQKRREIQAYMNQIGLECQGGTATFYFFVSIAPSKLSSEEFCTRLLQEDLVCVVPGLGYGYSCDKFVRVSIGTATLEENKYGLDKIKSLIEKTK